MKCRSSPNSRHDLDLSRNLRSVRTSRNGRHPVEPELLGFAGSQRIATPSPLSTPSDRPPESFCRSSGVFPLKGCPAHRWPSLRRPRHPGPATGATTSYGTSSERPVPGPAMESIRGRLMRPRRLRRPRRRILPCSARSSEADGGDSRGSKTACHPDPSLEAAGRTCPPGMDGRDQTARQPVGTPRSPVRRRPALTDRGSRAPRGLAVNDSATRSTSPRR